MTLHLNQYGDRYDDAEPCFFATSRGKMLFNRVKKKWLDRQGVLDRATALSWEMANREIGVPSIAYQMQHPNGDYEWGPGIDSDGLTSELLTNGEDWTGATGATPPTGWTAVGVAPVFTLATGVLTITSGDTTTPGMYQDLTTVAGTAYVVEIDVTSATGAFEITVGDATLQGNAGQTGIISVGFIATDTTTRLQILGSADGAIATAYTRVYLESELLTGTPVVVGVTLPTPTEPPVCPPVAEPVAEPEPEPEPEPPLAKQSKPKKAQTKAELDI